MNRDELINSGEFCVCSLSSAHSDINGNIFKIGEFVLNHCESICYLNQIVEYEKLNIKDEGKFDNYFIFNFKILNMKFNILN